ncbi:aldo/keto reductase-like protein [Clavulina sp. PMI_390]|nr:aldo/keto reductase-like protein [Clavulina sp. PMI_390]
MSYGDAEQDELRFKVLDRLYALGERDIDTARVYGDSEELLGRWFKQNPGIRETVFLATKCGFIHPMTPSGNPDAIRSSFKTSLEKLDLESVDLIYLHRPDAGVPIEVSVLTLAEFVKEGKAKYIGLSEVTPATLRRAHKVHPIAAVQLEYSPIELTHEAPGGLIDTCKELGIAMVAYAPTARGLLSGHWTKIEDFTTRDVRHYLPRFKEENLQKVLKVVEGLKEIGAEHGGATPAQVALAWIASQGIISIPGAKRLDHVEENLGADKVELSPEEIERIRELGKASGWMDSGLRHTPGGIALSYVETPPLEGWQASEVVS